jgi:preprotein translocase subunit SecG|tara:strand:- start:4 stop:396 length:393 start_codon:yes stop_codon:yes gene_type:complete
MFELLLVIHVIACISIIFFVLLQSGRGAELGAAFGSVGQANSVRGSMTGIGKITTGVAVVFMLTSLTLAYLSSESARDSVVRDLKPSVATPAKSEQIQIPEEIIEEDTEGIPPAELEQKIAPPIESSSDN